MAVVREYTSDKHVAASSLTTGYHVYSAVWTPCSINGYNDDQLYFSLSINTADKTEFHEPFYSIKYCRWRNFRRD